VSTLAETKAWVERNLKVTQARERHWRTLIARSNLPTAQRIVWTAVRDRLAEVTEPASKEQYGVQIVYKDPEAAGANPDSEARWHWFDHIEQADTFAARPAHDMRTPGKYGGVKEVNRATRWAIEVYGEPVHNGQSVPCYEIRPGGELPEAQCLLLKGHDGPHDMMGLVQWS
jgi:hypothetical protein